MLFPIDKYIAVDTEIDSQKNDFKSTTSNLKYGILHPFSHAV